MSSCKTSDTKHTKYGDRVNRWSYVYVTASYFIFTCHPLGIIKVYSLVRITFVIKRLFVRKFR